VSNEELAQDSEKPRAKASKVRIYVMLHMILLLYSLAAVCSKKAALSPFLSFHFFAWYAGVLVILMIYALVWQQVLKHLPLFTAFLNKGITIVWGILWGALIFSEAISITMLLGAAIVFTGIMLVVSSNVE
jgi:drug/metabolite transporter (DMT)-like permease